MHNNTPIVPYISLCSGYEGIGLGLHRCIPNLRCIAYCERESFAIANLVAKMENGLLDAAPVFTDVTTFPWEQYAPYMAGGILSFGWPCQPVSCAGKRKATEDERWLFDIIADGVAIMRPGFLFAENVEGLLSAKMPNGSLVFAHCIERLESLHYKVAAGIFSASEVGAPHQRKRVFILAYRNSEGLEGRFSELAHAKGWSESLGLTIREGGVGGEVWPSRPGEPQHAWEPPRTTGRVATNTGVGKQIPSQQRESRDLGTAPSQGGSSNDAADGTSEVLGNTSNQRCEKTERALRGKQQSSGASEECGLGVAEAMGNAESWRRGESGDEACKRQGHWPSRSGGSDDEQRKTEQSMGLHSNGTSDGLGHAELSGLCDSELAEIREWMVKCDNRTDELRLLGNGVVPATATRAFLNLLEELNK